MSNGAVQASSMSLLAEVIGSGNEHPLHVGPLLAVLPGGLEFGVAHVVGDRVGEFVGGLAPERELFWEQIMHGVEQRVQAAQAVDVALAKWPRLRSHPANLRDIWISVRP